MTLPAGHVAGAFAPLEALPMLVAAALYAKRTSTLAGGRNPVPLWRQWCFAGGLLLIAVALFSPLGHMSEELLTAHMVEHLLIADLAALLLVLGLTGQLLQPILSRPVLGRLRLLGHPAVALPLWALDLYLWHASFLYDAAYGPSPIHALEHTMFLSFGVIMWMPLFGPLPTPSWFTDAWKVGYAVAVRFTGAVLANVLMWSGTVLYDGYAEGERHWDVSPLTDQGTAGVVMMVEGSLVTLAVLAWFFLGWARRDSERQRLLDLAESRGVALDEARAARAVAAGEGPRLERRLREGDGLAGANADSS
jgi:cytochrome c oxidase assembly factor CtaG